MPSRRPARSRVAALVLLAALTAAACSRPVDVTEEPGGTVVETAPPQTTAATPAPPSPTPTPTATPTPEASIDDVAVELTEVATGLSSPVLVTAPPDDPRRFVVEQTGRIHVLDDGELSVFLDLGDRVTSGGERGLLGAAFHPDFPADERLFVHYSGEDGRTVLAAVDVPDGDAADPRSLRTLLEVDQPAGNHNGGTVTFGPDGMLYLGLGDGGAANDRFGNGQRPDTLLGTVLRLDVSAGDGTYAIPPDNPYADGSGGAPEVWMYGLRNPYRFAFDESRIYIADVGQNAVEEIDVLPADTAGANLGWPVLEGSDCFASSPCDADGTVLPTVEYRHADTGGCAVIGGEVYAGEVAPLRGHYFFGDLCAGFVRSLTVADDGTVTEIDWTPQIGAVDGLLSFGKDAAGEIYLTTQDGRVLRLSASLPG